MLSCAGVYSFPGERERNMKLQAPENANYAATVVEIRSIIQLENCDNVVATPLEGFQGIVGKDTQVGDIGIVFTAETQLSLEYASRNNLHRHAELNSDPEAKPGFFEDNRRVKALKFRGHRSDCLFMPLDSLSYVGDISHLQPGDTFDMLGDHGICQKYVVKRQNASAPRAEKNKVKAFKRVDEKFLPEHYDTDSYFRNADAIAPGRRVTMTQKLHGTSIRVGNTLVKRKLTWRDRLAARLGVKVQATEYDNVYGSRKVIKDVNNPNQAHYYGTDIWSEEGRKLDGIIPQNYIVYGELIGWTKDGAPIQKGYTYQVAPGTCELYIYRIAFINGQGRIVDLAWDQVKEFCAALGLKHVPELWDGEMGDLQVEHFLDRNFHKELGRGVPLAKESPCDEGVCIRVDGLAPYVLKAKSPAFFRHETRMLDAEVIDLEADGSLEAAA